MDDQFAHPIDRNDRNLPTIVTAPQLQLDNCLGLPVLLTRTTPPISNRHCHAWLPPGPCPTARYQFPISVCLWSLKLRGSPSTIAWRLLGHVGTIMAMDKPPRVFLRGDIPNMGTRAQRLMSSGSSSCGQIPPSKRFQVTGVPGPSLLGHGVFPSGRI